MYLSVTQVQNVLRTYQKQVREERVKAVLGVGDKLSRWKDRLDISREGRDRLVEDPPRRPSGGDPSNRPL